MNFSIRSTARLLASAIVLFGEVTLATTLPPAQPFEAITWKPTLKQEVAKGFNMGQLYIGFEATTLEEVRKAIGLGTIAHKGDAGDSVSWLCYTDVTAVPALRIWITSGELQGGKYVDGVIARTLTQGHPNADCPAPPVKMRPFRVPGANVLNSSSNAVMAVMGAPSHRKGEWWSFDFQGKVPGQCEPDGFDYSNNLLLHFVNGKVMEIFTNHATSC